MKRARVVAGLGVVGLVGVAALVACGSDSSGGAEDADAAVTPAPTSAPTGTPTATPTATGTPDATPPPPDASPSDAQADAPVDAGPPSARGLRVTFLGTDVGTGALRAFLEAATGAAPTRIDPTPLAATDLATTDVLVADGVRAYSADEAQALAAWVASGKGLVALSGFSTSSANTRSLTAAYDIDFGPFTGGPEYAATFAPHPVSKDVASLYFFGGFPVLAGADAAVPQGPATSWVTLANGTPIGVARAFGQGRVVVYGDEWILYDSEVNRPAEAGADAGPLDAGAPTPDAPTRQFWWNAVVWAAGRS